jgi:hypothetical protein
LFIGSGDRLYSLDENFSSVPFSESVGGTHANRMIHRESNQLIIGLYFIDAAGNVRSISPTEMPGRMTAVARHLTDPANKVYFYTMEQGLYEVDVHTLQVKTLHGDLNITKSRPLLPGNHGKGAYTGQGRLVVTHNGNGGVLAEWDGTGNPADPNSWTIVDRNKYTEITGPGGIFGADDGQSPLWALGWDQRSVLLNVRQNGEWTRFRLPKGSYTHEADHGWYTEWPRIRDTGRDHLLMDVQGMYYAFPRSFAANRTAGIRPISQHLQMSVDFAEWNGWLVIACNDASKFDNPLLGRNQSNLRFIRHEQLSEGGAPGGWGGPWIRDRVAKDQPSEPYLFGGFEHRVLHLSHESDRTVRFALEADRYGNGHWELVDTVSVAPRGYEWRIFPVGLEAEWIRLKADQDAEAVTAYFHYGSKARYEHHQETIAKSLAAKSQALPRSAGLLRPGRDPSLPLEFAADILDADGQLEETAFYILGLDEQQRPRLKRSDNPESEQALRRDAAIIRDYRVDEASVIVESSDGQRYRLPKGDPVFDELAAASSPTRGIREVVTERSLLNAHGTIYELPRASSGGIAKMKPVCTHNRLIHDFCSWRGMLVLTGVNLGSGEDEQLVRSDDGKAALWIGNVDDLWKFGSPQGFGGPWNGTSVRSGEWSDPYLMAGYHHKTLRLSHESHSTVTFTVQIDFTADGTWHLFQTLDVPAGETVVFHFPLSFSAHWIRFAANRDCKATALLEYR